MILTIFGYPKTGKTLLFNLLTESKEKLSKFSTSTSELHKATVDVPDERLKKLADYHDTPPVYAKIEFLDTGSIAWGEVKNATFIDLIRRADGLVHLVRAFEDEEILHGAGSVDPARDVQAMESELLTTDFITVEKRLERLAAEVRKTKSKELLEEQELLVRVKAHLEADRPLREFSFTAREASSVRGFGLLSQKPLLHLVNADESTLAGYRELASPAQNGRAVLVFAGKIEQELLDLPAEEREMFTAEYGLTGYTYIRDVFVKTSFSLMNLISFFTVGSDETRAWPIAAGSTAWEAAGKIHSDIQRGFIRAEVIGWQDFLACDGFPRAKEKGLLRLEGKEYVVLDGEIVHFRFNA